MRFTVVWRKSADDKLAELWIKAEDRAAVTAAADEMNARLRVNPFNCGVKESEQLFEWIVPPLVILYSADEDDRLVTVEDVDRVV